MSDVKLSGLTVGTRLRAGDLLETTQVVTATDTTLALTGALVNPFAEMPPSTAGALDDEFDESSLAGIWSWVNQQSTSVSFQNSYIILTAPASQSQCNMIVQSVPGSTPWTITTRLSVNSVFANNVIAGLVLRASGSGAFRLWAWANTENFNHQYWTSPSSISTSVFNGMNSLPFTTQMYLRIYNDGTNFNFQYSLDGITYVTLSSVGVTNTITPNQVGLVVYNSSGVPMLAAFDFFRQS